MVRHFSEDLADPPTWKVRRQETGEGRAEEWRRGTRWEETVVVVLEGELIAQERSGRQRERSVEDERWWRRRSSSSSRRRRLGGGRGGRFLCTSSPVQDRKLHAVQSLCCLDALPRSCCAVTSAAFSTATWTSFLAYQLADHLLVPSHAGLRRVRRRGAEMSWGGSNEAGREVKERAGEGVSKRSEQEED
eukprot:768041-Hanusia_phi.AAC.7